MHYLIKSMHTCLKEATRISNDCSPIDYCQFLQLYCLLAHPLRWSSGICALVEVSVPGAEGGRGY